MPRAAAALGLAAAVTGAAAVAAYLRRHRTSPLDARIDAVLAFWFGDGTKSIDVLQRSLWFARGSARDAADRAVAAAFGAGLVRAAVAGDLDGWAATPRGAVALIVVLDQFARHVFRGGDGETIEAASRKARAVADRCFGAAGVWDAARCLSPAQHVFALMPVRHGAAELPPKDEAAALRSLLDVVDARAASDDLEKKALDRFRAATAKRLREATAPAAAAVADAFGAFDDDAILERPFVPCAPAALKAALVDSAVGACLARFVLDECARRGYRARVLDAGSSRFDRRGKTVPLCVVSLSGGVDSMVLCWVLAKLRDFVAVGEDSSFSLAACHVDYGNRPESKAEAAFLKTWCDKVGVDLTVLVMPETLKRATCDRETYEVEARERRYDLYRKLAKRAPVLLAHHAGDVGENCVSNVFKGAGVLELSGMRDRSVTQGVTVARPLLPLEKEDVYAVAHACGVPYFKDSTPSWSTRGRLRNELLPLLRDVYGAGCPRHVLRLALDSDSVRDLADSRIFGSFRATVTTHTLGTRAELGAHRDESDFFWKTSMRDLATRSGRGQLSAKALGVLLARLRGDAGGGGTSNAISPRSPSAPSPRSRPKSKGPPVAGWLELKKGWRAYLSAAGVLYLFDDAPFDPPPDEGASVRVDQARGDPQRLGHWDVEAFYDSDDDDDAPDGAALDRFFATGAFTYAVDAPPGEALRLASSGLRKYKPIQRLDDLTKSPKLRGAVPVAAPPSKPKADVVRVRVTATFVPPPKAA